MTGSCLVTSPEFTKESSLIRGVCQISQISLECRGNHILYCDLRTLHNYFRTRVTSEWNVLSFRSRL